MKKYLSFLILSILTFHPLFAVKFEPTQALNCDYIHIKNVQARLTPLGTGAVYATIKNHNKQTLELIDASTNLSATTQIHHTLQQKGVATMQHVEKFTIPAQTTLHLKKGDMHLMLFDVKLLETKKIKVRWVFSNGCLLNTTGHIISVGAYQTPHAHQHHHSN